MSNNTDNQYLPNSISTIVILGIVGGAISLLVLINYIVDHCSKLINEARLGDDGIEPDSVREMNLIYYNHSTTFAEVTESGIVADPASSKKYTQ